MRQVLTARHMRAAEQTLFDAGISESALMELAAGRAAQWVRRFAAGRSVTVLCGPGNNGGDGYVIARTLRSGGQDVEVIAPLAPGTGTAEAARSGWSGPVRSSGSGQTRGVLVDCLFGSGLTRPLSPEHNALLRDLAQRHERAVAIDVPSGMDSDSGVMPGARLPGFDLTLAIGAWKFAHCLTAAREICGTMRLVPIGIGAVEGAAERVSRPRLSAPAAEAHKYTRGLLAVVGGAMPGASLLAARAAMRAGAGYVKCLAETEPRAVPAGLVRDPAPLGEALDDPRIGAVCIGPGLGRDQAARTALAAVLGTDAPAVLDADALHCLVPAHVQRNAPLIATPHDGELTALCRAFAVVAEGRMQRAQALSRASGMVVLAKGPDSFIAAPDGRLAIGRAATSWLSVAGTGDVLAGIIASRLATGADPFAAACEGQWLHGEAARLAGAAFTADDLADTVSRAVSRCL